MKTSRTIDKIIARRFRELDDSSIQAGFSWYAHANAESIILAERHFLSVKRVCAIIAVVSPGTRWEQNLQDAEKIIRFGEQASVTSYSRNKDKAIAILRGGRVSDYVKGQKVRAFFDNLYRPRQSKAVTIDRWMVRVLTGAITEKEEKAVFDSRRKYSDLADCVRRYADKIGILPSQLQAALWIGARRENNYARRV